MNYNGHIELAVPKNQVLNAVQRGKPIRYSLFFPRWEEVPPRITKILVNGELVCSGPPIEHNGYFRVITTVNLQHRFIISVTPLRTQNPVYIPENSISNQNPFFSQGGKNNQPPFLLNENTNINNNQEPVQFENNFANNHRPSRGDFDTDVLDVIFTSTTPRSTRSKSTPNSVTANDLLFSENPFLTGRRPLPSSPINSQRGGPSNPTAPSESICGLPVVPNPLIFNGNSILHGAFPWLAAMFASTGIGVEYQCSGSLVSTKHIITAAHCLQKRNTKVHPDKLLFILGKTNIENLLIGDGELMAGAQGYRIHPDYTPLTSDADIAVVILSQTIQYTKYIRPICIWSESDDIELVVGLRGKVVGWGKDENNISMTSKPKEVTLPIVSQEQCLRSSEAFKGITSNRTFCAGERNDKGPCNGDSGSGFIMKRNGRWSLKGLVSISLYDSIKSCDLSHYVVYTDVSKFRTWLFSIINI